MSSGVKSQGSGNALDFDGTDDFVSISDAAALDIQDEITIEFWFLLEGESSNNNFPRAVAKGLNNGSNGAYGIFIKDVTDPDDIAFRFIDGGNNLQQARSQSVPNYDDGEWHHVAGVYSNDGNFAALYVDGLLEASASITGNTQIRTTADDLTIGTAGTNRFFNGRIDDVRIWNVARTEQEVREFMCAKLTGSESGLVGYWNFDGASTGANNVPDLTSNNLDGTMTNMASDDVVTSGAPMGDESIYAYIGDWGGNALEFDGSDDYVDIGDVLIDGLSEVTVEAWIYPTAVPTKASPSGHNSNEGAIIHKSGSGDDNIGLTVSTGGLAFYIDNGSDNTLIGTQPTLNTWTHVAATYDGTNLIIYQDGVLDDSQASNGSSNIINNSNNLRLGGGHIPGGSPHEFTGRIDEVRVWNYARTANEIVNDMCRSLEGDESGLIGYWRLDELVNSTTIADAISGNNGSLTNMNAASDWVDADHTCDYTGFELYMASAQADSFRVSSFTGDPEGFHIYSVTDVPSSTTGITGLGDNNTYYGVWKVEGTSPTYTGTYFYDGNDAWEGTMVQVEANLRLFTRADNAAASWSDVSASLNAVENSLTATAQNTEFIIGLTGGGVLPIELIDFQATLEGDQVNLNWSTASERMNELFVVEKSTDLNQWTEVLRQPGALNSSVQIDYHGVDPSPYLGWSYYRLKQIDLDGSSSYSEVRVIHYDISGSIRFYPNPVHDRLYLQAEAAWDAPLQLLNALGQDVSNRITSMPSRDNVMILDMSSLTAGVYYLRVGDQQLKVLKQ